MGDPSTDPVEPTEPTPTDPPQDPPAATPPTEDGKGGKDAILADLAKERDKRQGLESQLTDFQTRQQEQMDAIAKALGLKSDDTPPDPAKLTEQITLAQSEAAAANRELAVFKAAPALEANASELLDSASFLRSIADIDPTDSAALANAITTALEANPKFKASQTPTTPPFNGGPRSSAPTRAGSMGEAIANKIAAQSRR